MTSYQKNNRVVVTDGQYHGQAGKVVDDITGILDLQRQYQIKLDGGATVNLGGSLRDVLDLRRSVKCPQIVDIFADCPQR